jgi:hypothetical protein
MIEMTRMIKVTILLLPLSLAACASSQHYAAGSGAVLVQPTLVAWIKPGATEEERNQALRQCGQELDSNEQLRKGSRDARSDAYTACMARSGFVHHRDKNRRAK